MKKLGDILSTLKPVNILGSTDIDIVSVKFNSRRVNEGDLFIAVRGTVTDGHKYINDAIRSGAVAVICEELPAGQTDPENHTVADKETDHSDNITWIQLEDSSLGLALAASAFYDNPSSNLGLIGITGTNGKTTIASLLYDLFTSLGYKCGLLSTVVNKVAGRELEATHTTPDPVVLNSLMAEMVKEGCEYTFMEVSSHALVQNRTAGLDFRGGVFTNLTHEHLDYHGNFRNYLNAKKLFFDSLPADAFALVNSDDRNGKVMVQNCKAELKTYSLKSASDFHARILEHRFDGMQLKIDEQEVWLKLIGEFNAYNLLAVAAVAELLGEERFDVLTQLSRLNPVPGRLEIMRSAGGATAIVDYAHTPDALKNVIETINRIRVPGMSLITVVGAGGDRDRTKRPEMALISAEGSDKLILTSDNPRGENPESIIDDMIKGVPAERMNRVLRITDRREAIRTAAMLAAKDDIILVAGKGHETYQEINGKRSHFDDREELRKVLISAN